MTQPTLITGHGRSGTHWLAHVLSHFVDVRHEPGQLDEAPFVVDCRRYIRAKEHAAEGVRVLHLVRDGRDVVRSTHEFYQGDWSFKECCEAWAMVTKELAGFDAMRLEDLMAKQAASAGYRLSHWTEWPESMTEDFWRICGDAMRRHGYER